MHITGGCHCGAIRYQADVDPTRAAVCHCTDCQVLSGGPFRVVIRAAPDSFRITAGTPRVYTKIAESGNAREQAFCDQCGSSLYATSPGPEPRVYTLRIGSIDQRAELHPAVEIWTRSRLRWLDELPAVPKVDQQLPG